MLVQKNQKIGEIVSQNFQTAKVFESFGVDFCCGGKKTISDACSEKSIDPYILINELEKIEELNATGSHYGNWEVDFLIDYIVNNHHWYVVNSVSTIEHHFQQVITAHGEKYPALAKIESIFAELKNELLNHLVKEEKMLFPYIKKLQVAYKNGLELPFPPFGSVGSPIRITESEHEHAGRFMEEISRLANSYEPPKDACGRFKLLYAELKDFENDLHMHVHLENNILFPKAVKLEEKLNNKSSNL
jgi:regulator of cell morphogenesis and NO signaling